MLIRHPLFFFALILQLAVGAFSIASCTSAPASTEAVLPTQAVPAIEAAQPTQATPATEAVPPTQTAQALEGNPTQQQQTIDAFIQQQFNSTATAQAQFDATQTIDSALNQAQTATAQAQNALNAAFNQALTATAAPPQTLAAATLASQATQTAVAVAAYNQTMQAQIMTATGAPVLTMQARISNLQPITTANASKLELQLTLRADEARSVAFSPDGKWLAVGTADGTVVVFNTTDWKENFEVSGRRVGNDVAFSPDNTLLASGWNLWNYAEGDRNPDVLTVDETDVQNLAFSNTGILGIAGRKAVHLVDIESKRILQRFEHPNNAYQTGQTYGIAFNNDGTLIAYGSGTDLVVRRTDNGEEVATLATDVISGVAFLPNGSSVAAANIHGVVRLWDLTSLQAMSLILTSNRLVMQGLVFNPDGSILLSTYRNDSVGLWDVSERKLLVSLDGDQDRVTDIAISSDGRMIASVSFANTLCIWGVPAGA